MNRVLVTGGCGFVGRRFVRRFLDVGCEVTVVDDLSTSSHPRNRPAPANGLADHPRLHLHILDVRDYLRSADPRRFDLCVHLAAVVGGRLTIERDPLRIATDLAIDAAFFNWLAGGSSTPPRVVYFSSSAAYPTTLQTRANARALSEDDIDLSSPTVGMPDMTYGWAKLTGELLARYAQEHYGIPVACYRPFSGYGEDQDASYPFPSICKRVLDREDPLVVWGSGDQARDFIHIDDIVDAVLATFDKIDATRPLNLGSGEATTFVRLAELASGATGYRPTISTDPSKPEGVFWRVSDPTEMHLLYRPRVSLAEGIVRCLDYLALAEERRHVVSASLHVPVTPRQL